MKNKQYFFVKRYIYSFFRYFCSIFIVLLFASDNVFALPKCTADISDNGDSVQSEPTDDTNKLFVILKKDEIDKDNICYSSADDYVKCDIIRLEEGMGCTNKFACQDGFSISCENGQCGAYASSPFQAKAPYRHIHPFDPLRLDYERKGNRHRHWCGIHPNSILSPALAEGKAELPTLRSSSSFPIIIPPHFLNSQSGHIQVISSKNADQFLKFVFESVVVPIFYGLISPVYQSLHIQAACG